MQIPNSPFEYYEEAVDALLASTYTSKEVNLYYEKKATHSGLGLDATGGVDETILIDTIRLRLYNKDKKWSQAGGVEFVDGMCKIIGLSTDKANIKKCTYLEIDGQHYKLVGEPLGHGFGTKYFAATIQIIK